MRKTLTPTSPRCERGALDREIEKSPDLLRVSQNANGSMPVNHTQAGSGAAQSKEETFSIKRNVGWEELERYHGRAFVRVALPRSSCPRILETQIEDSSLTKGGNSRPRELVSKRAAGDGGAPDSCPRHRRRAEGKRKKEPLSRKRSCGETHYGAMNASLRVHGRKSF